MIFIRLVYGVPTYIKYFVIQTWVSLFFHIAFLIPDRYVDYKRS